MTVYPDTIFQDLFSYNAFAKNKLSVHEAANPFQLVTGILPSLPSVLSDALLVMLALGARDDERLLCTLNRLVSSREVFYR